MIIHLRNKINSDEVISWATKGSSAAIQDLKGLWKWPGKWLLLLLIIIISYSVQGIILGLWVKKNDE